MRRICYSVAMSLDGFIAGPNGEFDWIPHEPTMDWNAFMSRFDTAIMGRRTYEVALAAGLPCMRNYVVSRTLTPAENPKVTILRDDLAGALAEIRRAPGRDIWLFGGGELFRGLLEINEVDVIETAVVPILLGGGVPFLPGAARRIPLQLTDSHRYPSGIMLLTYQAQTSAATSRP